MLERVGVKKSEYLLATVHRSDNTDDSDKLSGIIKALNSLEEKVVFPIHPRARKAITHAGCPINSNIHLIDPVGYMDMIALTVTANLVHPDSRELRKQPNGLCILCD